jgi:preprotein translocase subunit SecY
MISAFFNIRKIPELRNRILFTLLMIVLYRIGCSLTCPGVNASVLRHYFSDRVADTSNGGVMQLFNIFSGGALEQCAIFSLGVMPYISASIMIQLLTAVVPQLGKLAKEDGGRQKIMQFTRYVTIILCLFQGWFMTRQFMSPPEAMFPHISDTMAKFGPVVSAATEGAKFWFQFTSVICLTAGTMFLMWIGDQITDRGIGNGMSMIISVGIIAKLPAALVSAWKTIVPTGIGAADIAPLKLVLMLAFLIIVIAGVICITQAQRRITISYAKRVVGRKVYGGVNQYMPLKVNYAGVMPIIFAQALLVFPSTMITMMAPGSAMHRFAEMLNRGWLYYVVFSAMIFFFSYFWVATQFQPQQIADDLKKAGGYIPGVRPGKPTAEFLDNSMTRLTFAGSVFLTVIAMLPHMLSDMLHIPQLASQFFGGTSLLIVVGVVLDTMRQIETHLLQRHYDGFLRKGKLRGRFDRSPEQRGEAAANNAMIFVSVGVALLILAGIVIFLLGQK